jgi:hypothetical protein
MILYAIVYAKKKIDFNGKVFAFDEDGCADVSGFVKDAESFAARKCGVLLKKKSDIQKIKSKKNKIIDLKMGPEKSESIIKDVNIKIDKEVARKVEEEPVKEEPVKEEPVKEEPVKEEPVKEEPAKKAPAKKAPAKKAPAKKAPAKKAPAKKKTSK